MAAGAVLGYHKIGEFHFFAALPEAATWLGSRAEDSFRTHESFLSLVTAVHETYHVIQDILLGICCWASALEDDLAAHAGTACATPAPLASRAVDSVLKEVELVSRLVYSTELTERLIRSETNTGPGNATDFQAAMLSLTGQDLLECHAAILTEIYIARLMQARPGAFSQPVVDDLAECFRVPLMPKYNRPLKIFRTIMNPIVDFDRAGRAHPLYTQCSCIVEYGFLAFLIDVALHVQRPDWITRYSIYSALSVIENVAPPCRFLKLTFAYFQRVLEAKRTGSSMYITVPELYSSLSRDLIRLVNVADTRARAKSRAGVHCSARLKQLFRLGRSVILRVLSLHDRRHNFLEFDSVTSSWLAHYERHPLRSVFPRIYSTRVRAMQLRLSNPGIMFAADVNPLGLLASLGIPTYFRTPEGVKFRPPAILVKHMGKADLNQLDLAFAIRTVSPTRTASGKQTFTVIEDVGLPYGFLNEVLTHEISVALATSLRKHVPMRCPLATNYLAFYDCPARDVSCRNVPDLERLPLKNCMARRIRDTVLPK